MGQMSVGISARGEDGPETFEELTKTMCQMLTPFIGDSNGSGAINMTWLVYSFECPRNFVLYVDVTGLANVEDTYR